MSIEINGELYRELRCSKCHKLICLEYVRTGRIAFNCSRCNEFTVFRFKDLTKTNENDIDWESEFRLKSKDMRGGEINNGRRN